MCAFLASPRSQTGKAMGRIEAAIEWIIFNSRWSLTPIYLGLVAALVLLVVYFLKEFVERYERAGVIDRCLPPTHVWASASPW